MAKVSNGQEDRRQTERRLHSEREREEREFTFVKNVVMVKLNMIILVAVHEVNSAVRFRREIWKGDCIDSRPCILSEGRHQIQRTV